MLVGIHRDPYGRVCEFSKIYQAILEYNNIDYVWLEASQPDFWQKVAELDLFIFRWYQIDDHHHLAKTIIPIIEYELGITCFPDTATCWHYDDKIREYYLLTCHDLPMIRSWIFWDKKKALNWLEHAELPVVFKLKGGASSNNVVLLHDKKQARRLVKKMFGNGLKSGHIPDRNDVRYKDFSLKKKLRLWGGNVRRMFRGEDICPYWAIHKNYALFQEFLPDNDYDTRITVLGDRAFAFRRFTRDNDFRASGSGRIDYDPQHIDLEMVKLAFKTSQEMKFQSMAYDIIYDRQQHPQIIEISYTYIPEAITRCPGYWDNNLEWHEGHLWPQYCHLVDTLKIPLRQPPLPY